MDGDDKHDEENETADKLGMFCSLCERFKDGFKKHPKWTLEEPSRRMRLEAVRDHERTDRHKEMLLLRHCIPKTR